MVLSVAGQPVGLDAAEGRVLCDYLRRLAAESSSDRGDGEWIARQIEVFLPLLDRNDVSQARRDPQPRYRRAMLGADIRAVRNARG